MENLAQYLPTIWIIIFIVLFFVELKTLTLNIMWYVISASVAFILSLSGISIILQVATFVVVGLVLQYTTGPITEKLLNKNSQRNELLNSNVFVVDVVDSDNNTYIVSDQDQTYYATSQEQLTKAQEVQILSVEDNMLVIGITAEE